MTENLEGKKHYVRLKRHFNIYEFHLQGTYIIILNLYALISRVFKWLKQIIKVKGEISKSIIIGIKIFLLIVFRTKI